MNPLRLLGIQCLGALNLRVACLTEKFGAVSNFIQTRTRGRFTLTKTERFPVISPRLKSARRTPADVIGWYLSSVMYAYGRAPHYGALPF
jgi:hypothetical protein